MKAVCSMGSSGSPLILMVILINIGVSCGLWCYECSWYEILGGPNSHDICGNDAEVAKHPELMKKCYELSDYHDYQCYTKRIYSGGELTQIQRSCHDVNWIQGFESRGVRGCDGDLCNGDFPETGIPSDSTHAHPHSCSAILMVSFTLIYLLS